ncbi:hypothetical protein E2C01_048135 [Portunus trituberculatus]|uniref:Uncharacterized protein n=1 Tax=Portunus trituberculatus TaxID=210409 RepID=A0A5B7G9R5_PORTR|nr:hypothetical protein [Portunus trituberculatus]
MSDEIQDCIPKTFQHLICTTSDAAVGVVQVFRMVAKLRYHADTRSPGVWCCDVQVGAPH